MPALVLDSSAILDDIATAAMFIMAIGLPWLSMIFVVKVMRWSRKFG